MESGQHAVSGGRPGDYHTPLLDWSRRFWKSAEFDFRMASEDGSIGAIPPAMVMMAMPNPLFMGFKTQSTLNMISLVLVVLVVVALMDVVNILHHIFCNFGALIGVCLFVPYALGSVLACLSNDMIAKQVTGVAHQNAEFAKLEKLFRAQLDELKGVEEQLTQVAQQMGGNVNEVDDVLVRIDRWTNLNAMTAALDAFKEADSGYGNSDRQLSGQELEDFFRSTDEVWAKALPEDLLHSFQKTAIASNYEISLKYIMLIMFAVCTRPTNGPKKAVGLVLLLLFAMEPQQNDRLTQVLEYFSKPLKDNSSYGPSKLKGVLEMAQRRAVVGVKSSSKASRAIAPKSKGNGVSGLEAPLMKGEKSGNAPQDMIPVDRMLPIAVAIMNADSWPVEAQVSELPPPAVQTKANVLPGPPVAGSAVSRDIRARTLSLDGRKPVVSRSLTIKSAPKKICSAALMEIKTTVLPSFAAGRPIRSESQPVVAGNSKSAKKRGPFTPRTFDSTVLDICKALHQVQAWCVLRASPYMKSMKPYMEGTDIYLYPIYVFPVIALGVIAFMFLWLLLVSMKASDCSQARYWYLALGILLCAAFLHANPDLFVTVVRLQFEIEGFLANNIVFRANLDTYEDKIKCLKVAEASMKGLNERFGGSLDKANQELEREEAIAKDGIVMSSSSFLTMYCDKDGKEQLVGEEFEDAMDVFRCIFGGVFRDFPAREDEMRAGLASCPQFIAMGVKVDKLVEILPLVLQAEKGQIAQMVQQAYSSA